MQSVHKKKKEISAKELRRFLYGKRVKLDCGHYHCLHNFSNTMVVLSDGRTCCHNCYN